LNEPGFNFKTNNTFKLSHGFLNGIYYLHKMHLIHRDIKPKNILVTRPDQKNDFRSALADFDLATNHFPVKTVAGTPGYIAPEMIERVLYEPKSNILENANEGIHADVFSVGITLFKLYFSETRDFAKFFEADQRMSSIFNSSLNSLQRKQTYQTLLDKMKKAHKRIEGGNSLLSENDPCEKLLKRTHQLLTRMIDPDPKKRKNYIRRLVRWTKPFNELSLCGSNRDGQLDELLNSQVLESLGNLKSYYYEKDNEIFAHYQGPDLPKIPRQGFKIHVSSPYDFESMVEIANAILPKLRKDKTRHKVVYGIDQYLKLKDDPNQNGKFISIYPRNVAELRKLAKELNAIFDTNENLKAKIYPTTPGEKNLNQLNSVTVRYGLLTSDEIDGLLKVNKNGEILDIHGVAIEGPKNRKKLYMMIADLDSDSPDYQHDLKIVKERAAIIPDLRGVYIPDGIEVVDPFSEI
jgi:serine/threonine protein kinase